MKPNGLTWDFKLIIPSRIENDIWRVVQDAVEYGVSVEQFRREAAQAWQQALQDKAKDADAAWRGQP